MGRLKYHFLLGMITNLLLASFAFGQQTDQITEQAPAASTTPDTVAVDNVTDDEKIARRLHRIYESTGWFSDINVKVSDGIVTISGQASSDDRSQWAGEIASRTTDVIGISNQLEVDSQVSIGDSLSVVGKSLNKLYRDFLLRLPFIVVGFAALILTWGFAKIIRLVLTKILDRQHRMRTSLKDLLLHLGTIATWLVGFLLATVIVFPGMTPAKALTVLGLGSVAIGFAFKDIFENFFAGVLILWRYPFDRGDFIQHGDIIGKVEEITIRNTMIRRTDGKLVVVPNGQLFKSNVEVLTNRPKRRVQITCGVGYGENVNKSREVIREAVASCETINGPKSVEVFASEFADSSINFEVTWWTGATPLEIRQSRDEVIEAIKSALDNADIEIPFPYRTLTFAKPIRLEQVGQAVGS